MIIKNSNFGRGLQHTKAKIQGQKATTNTQDSVVEVVRQSQHHAPNTYGFDMSNYPSNRLTNCPINCFIAYGNNEPAGFIDIYGGKTSANKHNGAELFLVVSPKYYGRNVGQSLINMAINWFNNQDTYDFISFPILPDVTPLKKLLDSSQLKLDKSSTVQRDGEAWIVYKYTK
jgi:hypothetical protein